MLVCYLDDSNASVSKVETIAGYVAEEEGWSRFEAAAEHICERESVDLIRGLNIEARKGCFEGWSLPKRERFLEEIGGAMRGNVLFGISRSIETEHFKNFKRRAMQLDLEHRKVFGSLSAFGFSFGNISHDLRFSDLFGLAARLEGEGVVYRLEAGSRNNGDVLRYVEAEVKNGNLHSTTEVIEVPKRSSWAIQISDLYAFYSRRRMNQLARFEGRLEFVPDIHRLHIEPKVMHDTGYIKEPGIRGTNVRTGETFALHGLVVRPA